MKILNLAETYLVGSQATRALFGMNLGAWATEGWLTDSTKTQATQMGGMGSGWIQGVSAAELLQGLVPGGATGQFSGSWTIPKAMRANIKTYGANAALNAIAIPIAFRIGKSVMRAPIAQVNRMLKMTRVGVKL